MSSVRTEAISYERRGGAVWVRMVRPEKLNPMDAVAVAELREAVRQAATESPVAFVLTGSERAFCAGADLKMARQLVEGGDPLTDAAPFLRAATDLMCEIEALPVPTIAAVNGVAAAGGLELILACDLALAARSAQIGDAHANFGLLPGAGGTQRLPRVAGLRNALWLMYTGRFVSAEEAFRMGIVNAVVDDAQLEGAVDELVATLAQKSPGGLARMKRLARAAFDLELGAGLEAEHEAAVEHMGSPDVREGLLAFAAKRPPRFRAQG